MESLKNYLDQLVHLDERNWKVFSSLFREQKLRKGEFFALEGRVEHSVAFLKEGVVRAFYRSRSGQEYNKTFFTDNEFFAAYSSLVTGQPNQINIQALTECHILVADYPSITALYEDFRQIERLARLLAEAFFVYKEKREVELVLLQADERYRIFQQEYPGLENLIPQYHIASYLGVTPTQLSRIRGMKS